MFWVAIVVFLIIWFCEQIRQGHILTKSGKNPVMELNEIRRGLKYEVVKPKGANRQKCFQIQVSEQKYTS